MKGKTKPAQSDASFKERLRFLMGDERPYSWCAKIGIKKGLFQYYWQRERIPKHDNLIKICDYTGCSLEWLITGRGEPYVDLVGETVKSTDHAICALSRQIGQVEELLGKMIALKKKAMSVGVGVGNGDGDGSARALRRDSRG